jgi:hypothetical protein
LSFCGPNHIWSVSPAKRWVEWWRDCCLSTLA